MSKKTSVPHCARDLRPYTPTHVVMTVRDGVPALHQRAVRCLFGSIKDAMTARYPRVTFAAATLMPDHVHLVIQAGAEAREISRAMGYFASRFARGLNRLARRAGAVFRDRFFSRVLATASELVRALRYVGLNPVKAGLCQRPEDWQASSIGSCLRSPEKTSAWTFSGWMYRLLGFADDAATALRSVLTGATSPRLATSRQNRLPFARGLPHFG
jgi:REP element-mobilizing transposase RayT